MERAPKGNIFVHCCFKEMLLLLLTSSKGNALHIIIYSNNAEKKLISQTGKITYPPNRLGERIKTKNNFSTMTQLKF